MKRVITIGLVLSLLLVVLSANLVSYATAARLVSDGDSRDSVYGLGLLRQYFSGVQVMVGDEVKADVEEGIPDSSATQPESAPAQPDKGASPEMATAPLSKYISLGAPAAEHYDTNKLRARCACDMIIHDGRLYVGCGDYDRNTGASPILSAPVSDPVNWTVEAIVDDEQIGRFYDYNGVLTIPGYDPLKSPEYGTYYQLIKGKWETKATLPHGLHNFDLAWFRGELFAAIGAYPGYSPVVVTDDGVNYRDIPMYKDGELVVTEKGSVVRSMNIYVLGDTLYADFWYKNSTMESARIEIYRYDADKDILEFVVDVKKVTHGGLYSPLNHPVWEKKALGDKMFITTGYLYYTTDMTSFNQINLPNEAVAYDMVVHDGRMYILSAYETGDQYQIMVHSVSEKAPTTLKTEVSFKYDQMPTAMTMDENNFFIGTGYWYEKGASNNGIILQVKR